MVQFLQSYMATGKTIVLTIQTLFSYVMPLLSNTLSRFVIAFLQMNFHLLISWTQSPSTVILKLKKIKLATASAFSPPMSYEVMGQNTMILVF